MSFSRLFVVASLFFGQVAAADTALAPLGEDDFHLVDPEWAAVGQLLFFDPILSGNMNISCATCHHPSLNSADSMSLSMGEGGIGLGKRRMVDPANAPQKRIPRNAPALFNLGSKAQRAMFHDGRVEEDAAEPFGIRMPEGRALERALPHALAAQTILPILSPEEMAGQPGENPVADAVAAKHILGEGGAWDLLAGRVNEIPGYRYRFAPLIGDAPIHITDVANALSHFISQEFRATQSPFDLHLAGVAPLPAAALRGIDLFTGKAGCSACHAGPLFSDNDFHAIGMPQIGPGKGHGGDYFRDTGRYAVTGDPGDMYRFRTPSLRNVAMTGPYGHTGAYSSLEAVVRHHLNPEYALRHYDPQQAALHSGIEGDDFAALSTPEELDAISAAIELEPVSLSDAEISDLLAFLDSLTDTSSQEGRLGTLAFVPSGLSLDPVQ